MIRPSDTLTLARTKLQSRKLLLAITVLLAGLLFGVLIMGISVATGVADSAQTFTKSALGNRYLVLADPYIPQEVYASMTRYQEPSDELREKLQKIENDYIAEQQKLATEYGIEFDKTSVQSVFVNDPFSYTKPGKTTKTVVETNSPAWKIYAASIFEEWAKTAPNTIDKLKTVARSYGATDFYQTTSSALSYMTTSYLAGGKEDITNIGQYTQGKTAYVLDGYKTSVRNALYTFTDQSIVNRFILPENDKRLQNANAIPVVMTTDEAVDMFGKQLGISQKPAAAKEQIAWTKDVMQKMNGQTYQMCYRSQGEITLISTIIEQQASKTTSDESLQYKLPTTPCGAIEVAKDTRTTAQKVAAQKQQDYQKAAGLYQPLNHQLLTFQIVGLMELSDTNATLTTDLQQFSAALLGAQFDSGAFIPKQMYDALPKDYRYESILNTATDTQDYPSLRSASLMPTIVSFPTAEAAQRFMKNEGCEQYATSCSKPFFLSAYGSNYLLMNEFSKLAVKAAQIALPIAIALAGIIILITMARVIIDSRHETAVFRALGAKRLDIMAVYITYSMMVAVIIAVFALFVGLGGAFTVNNLYGGIMTDYAKVAYGTFTTPLTFTFMGQNWPYIGIIVALVILISLIAVLPPLWRNVRRNPINDMRDDG